MRLKSLIAAIAAFAGLVVAIAVPAEASRKPRGWGEVQTVHHYGYYPRYNHVYHMHHSTDRYAYRWEQPRYYPYYNSGYWRPAHEVRRRERYALPPYYPAWGYPNHRYHQHGRRGIW